MNRLPAQKNKPKTNPILSAVGGFRKAKMNLKSLAKKSGHTPSPRLYFFSLTIESR